MSFYVDDINAVKRLEEFARLGSTSALAIEELEDEDDDEHADQHVVTKDEFNFDELPDLR